MVSIGSCTETYVDNSGAYTEDSRPRVDADRSDWAVEIPKPLLREQLRDTRMQETQRKIGNANQTKNGKRVTKENQRIIEIW